MESLAEQKFKSISIYYDIKRNLIGIPCGKSQKFGVADIDVVTTLKAPYSDAELARFVYSVLDHCYSKKHNDQSEYSAIEKYMHIKGFTAATRNLGLVSLVLFQKEGYSILPTVKDDEDGFVLVEESEIKLKKDCSALELAEGIKKCIRIVGETDKK